MKDVNSRQHEYLARVKLLTPEHITQWHQANKFSGGALSKSALVVMMIQHEPLFAGGNVQDGVSQRELNRLLSIPQECAEAWAAAVSLSYKPIDAAFSLLAVPELFSGSSFNRPVFDRALPVATNSVAAQK